MDITQSNISQDCVNFLDRYVPKALRQEAKKDLINIVRTVGEWTILQVGEAHAQTFEQAMQEAVVKVLSENN